MEEEHGDVDVNNYDKVNDSNWCKSEVITCGRFFSVSKVDHKFKVLCKCLTCKSEISGDISTCSNLKKHIAVSTTFLVKFHTHFKSKHIAYDILILSVC